MLESVFVIIHVIVVIIRIGKKVGIGGENVGPRFIDWNFISSRKERIEQAKQDWQAGRFAKVVGDEDEFIPYP